MNAMSNYPASFAKRETGSVLLVAMIFLIMLTMIALSMLGAGTLEERMAANDRNRQLGLQAAEAVLREAEAKVLALPAPFDPFDITKFTSDCTAPATGDLIGLCSIPATSDDPRWQTITWTDASKTRTFEDTTSQVANIPAGDQPRYIIELISKPYKSNPLTPCNPGLVNITARGLGRDNAAVFIQSTVRFKPSDC